MEKKIIVEVLDGDDRSLVDPVRPTPTRPPSTVWIPEHAFLALFGNFEDFRVKGGLAKKTVH